MLARPTNLPIDIHAFDEETKEYDFFTKQARLQIEARMALAQAKDMAHMQMQVNYEINFYILYKIQVLTC